MIKLLVSLVGILVRNMLFIAIFIFAFTILKPYIQAIIYHAILGPTILFGSFIYPSTFSFIWGLVGVWIIWRIIDKFL